MTISYGPTKEALEGYSNRLQELIERHGLRRICEVGGGANPALPEAFVVERGLAYTVLDISEAELAKAPAWVEKVVADVAHPRFAPPADPAGGGGFDLVFSKMLAEHVKEPAHFHRNIRRMLVEGGLAVHFFPTLYTLPYLVNLAIPEAVSGPVLAAFSPRDTYRQAKFPAYYRWCRGPTSRQLARLEGLGFDVLEYHGAFGHPRYYRRVPPLAALHRWKSTYLVRHPNPHLTSYARVVLRKRGGEPLPTPANTK